MTRFILTGMRGSTVSQALAAATWLSTQIAHQKVLTVTSTHFTPRLVLFGVEARSTSERNFSGSFTNPTTGNSSKFSITTPDVECRGTGSRSHHASDRKSTRLNSSQTDISRM